jgi:hypothetical protein
LHLGDHRGRRLDRGHGEKLDRALACCCGPGWATPSAFRLSAEPEEEVRVGYHILKSLGIRTRGVNIIELPELCAAGF